MRGRNVTSINILSLLSSVVSTVIVNATHTMGGRKQYQIPLGVQCGVPVLLFLLTIALPESMYNGAVTFKYGKVWSEQLQKIAAEGENMCTEKREESISGPNGLFCGDAARPPMMDSTRGTENTRS